MRGQLAKLLAAADVRALLRAVERHRHADRNRVLLLLSVRAGLRAGEMSALRGRMLEDPRGRVGTVIERPARARSAAAAGASRSTASSGAR